MATAITSNQNSSKQQSSTFGDLSSNNLAVQGDYYLGEGLSEGTLDIVFNAINKGSESATALVQKAVDALTGSTDQVANAYAEAYNETRSTVNAFKPLLMWGAVGLVAYFLIKNGKKVWK